MAAARLNRGEVVGLVADLGGTNARFGLVDAHGRLHARRVYRAADFDTVQQALAHHLRDAAIPSAPAAAVLSVAGQVTGGGARFSNLPGDVDEATLREAFGFQKVELINDFVAQALAVGRLSSHDLRPVGRAPGPRPGAVAVIGPGTGLEIAALAPGPAGDVVIASEGGHASFAPGDEVDLRLWDLLRARHGGVSIERAYPGQVWSRFTK